MRQNQQTYIQGNIFIHNETFFFCFQSHIGFQGSQFIETFSGLRHFGTVF